MPEVIRLQVQVQVLFISYVEESLVTCWSPVKQTVQPNIISISTAPFVLNGTAPPPLPGPEQPQQAKQPVKG